VRIPWRASRLESLQLYCHAHLVESRSYSPTAAAAPSARSAGLAATRPLLDQGTLQRLRSELFLPGFRVDLGLVLLGLWVFARAQTPRQLLFGTGDLRDLFQDASGRL